MSGISYIVPVYNGESTIYQCLESIFAQESVPEMEVIVVDNGSTDRTLEIVRNFPSVKLLVETLRGRSRARNAGAKAARQPLIAFIDCDVVLSPHWSVQLTRSIRLPFGAVQAPVRKNEIASDYHFLNPDSLFQTIDSAAMMIPRKIFLETGGFAEDFNRWEDSELTLRLMNFGYGLMVVGPSAARKIQRAGFLEKNLRAFEIGKMSGKALKTWFGNDQISIRDFFRHAAARRSFEGFFQLLGHAFSGAPLERHLPTKSGWIAMDDNMIISRNIFLIVAPDFFSLRTFNGKVNLTLRKGNSEFGKILKKAYMGEAFMEELIEQFDSAKLDSLILRRRVP